MSLNFQKAWIKEEIVYNSNLNAKPVNCHLNINYIPPLSSFGLEIISQTWLICSQYSEQLFISIYTHKGINICVHVYIHTYTLCHIKAVQFQRCSDKRESPSHKKERKRNQSKPCLMHDFHAAKAWWLLSKAGKKFKQMGDIKRRVHHKEKEKIGSSNPSTSSTDSLQKQLMESSKYLKTRATTWMQLRNGLTSKWFLDLFFYLILLQFSNQEWNPV